MPGQLFGHMRGDHGGAVPVGGKRRGMGQGSLGGIQLGEGTVLGQFQAELGAFGKQKPRRGTLLFGIAQGTHPLDAGIVPAGDHR